MGIFDRIGEMVVNLFSGKKGIVLILLVVIVAVGVWKYQFSVTPEEGISDSDLESKYKESKEVYDEMIRMQKERGISDSELPPEIQFNKYILESGLKMMEAKKLSNKANRTLDPENYSDEDMSRAIELYKESKEWMEKSKKDVLKAKNVADNDLRIKYADYSIKQIEYMILAEETRIKGGEAILNKDFDLAREYLKDSNKYVQKSWEWDEKRSEIHKKMKEEGMI